MAKDGTLRGGARPGTGPKPKALTDRIAEGKTAGAMVLPEPLRLDGEDIPAVKDYLKAKQKNGRPLRAEEIYNEVYEWLRERGCEKLVSRLLVEQYAIIDQDYGIIAGHGRVMAAKEEGIEEVPCVFVDYLTEAQKKAYILADNRFAQDAGWDEDLLRIEIESLQGADFDVSLTGFDPDELADLFADDSDSDVKDDDFDLSAALEKAAFVKKGDIWTVGRHRLMCGDATNAGDVAALMDGKRANLVVTDPPYGVSFKSSDGLTESTERRNSHAGITGRKRLYCKLCYLRHPGRWH